MSEVSILTPWFGSFPTEIDDLIMAALDLDAVAYSLALTSKALYDIFNPILYQRAVAKDDYWVALWAARENRVETLQHFFRWFAPDQRNFDIYLLTRSEITFQHGPVDVEIRRRAGRYWAPIHEAARYGSMDALKYLLENGAKIDSPSSCFSEDIFPVCESSYHIDFKDRVGLDIRPYIEFTPLIVAILYHQSEVTEFLLKSGASIDTRFTATGETSGVTALHIASALGAGTVVKQLIEGGHQKADVEDPEGYPPLMWSAMMEDGVAAMRALVDGGADLEYKVPSHLRDGTPEDRHTMVTTLTKRGNKDAAARLVAFGAAQDPEEEASQETVEYITRYMAYLSYKEME